MTTHLMLDTETLGTRPGAVILSAALVRFSDEAQCTVNIAVGEQQALGCFIDPATHAWWGQQDPHAWALATQNPVSVVPALQFLSSWIAWAGPDPLIWCHGATFDAPLLGELYRLAGVPCPWPFWSVRDTRTLYDLAGINPKDYSIPPPHVALNDAVAQARAANAALGILARAHQPQRRYFFVAEHNAVTFTDDGSVPAGGQEIGANEYTRVVAVAA